ncbi:MAG TPA: mannonate dehydratase, partial [Candidatus Latescibacteria bacterium]|nr:mannonate dehydratase [Candidatus Latescibacterota bacterium]
TLVEHDPKELTHGRVFTHEEMWDNYNWYLERILPVAEEANVRLALHPDDPPTRTTLGGIARICSSFDDFKRNMDTFDSPHHGLDFCMGCWSEMGGHDNVIRAIRHFGSQGKIIYIHFRDVIGPVDDFYETFIDCGQVDTFKVVQVLKEVGFDGFMITDHVPHVVEDSPWGHRGRAHCVGFMQALIQVANKLG